MSKILAVDGQRFVQTTIAADEKTGETQVIVHFERDMSSEDKMKFMDKLHDEIDKIVKEID